jgi:ribosomal protein S7
MTGENKFNWIGITLQAESNTISKEIGMLMKNGKKEEAEKIN